MHRWLIDQAKMDLLCTKHASSSDCESDTGRRCDWPYGEKREGACSSSLRDVAFWDQPGKGEFITKLYNDLVTTCEDPAHNKYALSGLCQAEPWCKWDDKWGKCGLRKDVNATLLAAYRAATMQGSRLAKQLLAQHAACDAESKQQGCSQVEAIPASNIPNTSMPVPYKVTSAIPCAFFAQVCQVNPLHSTAALAEYVDDNDVDRWAKGIRCCRLQWPAWAVMLSARSELLDTTAATCAVCM